MPDAFGSGWWLDVDDFLLCRTGCGVTWLGLVFTLVASLQVNE